MVVIPPPRLGSTSRQAGRVPGPTPRKGLPNMTGGNPLLRRGTTSQEMEKKNSGQKIDQNFHVQQRDTRKAKND